MKSIIEEEILQFVKNGYSYIESVILLCEKLTISPEEIAKKLSPTIIEYIKCEGISNNLLKRDYLPLDTGLVSE